MLSTLYRLESLILIFFMIMLGLFSQVWYDEELVISLLNQSWSTFLLPGQLERPVGGQIHYLLWLKSWSLIFGTSPCALRVFNLLQLGLFLLILKRIFPQPRSYQVALVVFVFSPWMGHYLFEIKHYFFDFLVMAWLLYRFTGKDYRFDHYLVCGLVPFYSLPGVIYGAALFSMTRKWRMLLVMGLSTLGYFLLVKELDSSNLEELVDFWKNFFLKNYHGADLVKRIALVLLNLMILFSPLLILWITLKGLTKTALLNQAARFHLNLFLICVASLIVASLMGLYPLPLMFDYMISQRVYVFLYFPLAIAFLRTFDWQSLSSRWFKTLLILIILTGGSTIFYTRMTINDYPKLTEGQNGN